jgi:hypothetical protein
VGKRFQNTNAVNDSLWPMFEFMVNKSLAAQALKYCLGEWNFSGTLHATSEVDWNVITATSEHTVF